MDHNSLRTAAQRRVFDEWYARHHDRVYRWASRYSGGNSAWAQDLVHDVFLRLWKQLPELTDQQDLGGWLYRVTANLAISKLRSERTFGEKVARLWKGDDDEDAVQRPDEAMDARQRSAAAMRALGTLPDRERVVLSMKFLDDQNQRDIATALGMSEGYVSKLVTRGIERLKAAGWEIDDES